jgi:hypothetical protein
VRQVGYLPELYEDARSEKYKMYLSVFLSVCPSVSMEQLVSHWRDFHEIWYLFTFRKSFEKG